MQRLCPWPITSNDVDGLLNDICSLRVAVLGDFCLDLYLLLDSSAGDLSVETGLPIRAVAEQRYSLGGAANVVANLVSLGCAEVRAFGVVGEDPFGAEMVRILRRTGVDVEGLLIQRSDWDTCVYTKVIEACEAGQNESNRIDYGNFNRLGMDTADQLGVQLAEVLANGQVDAVIINQQVRPGIHVERLRRCLKDLISRHPDTLWVTDSRDFSNDFAGSIRKLNEAEAVEALALGGPPQTAAEVACQLFRRWRDPVFVTRGQRGCLACDDAGLIELPAPSLGKDTDAVGAGDAFLAGLTTALAVGSDLASAALFGGLVAGVTVTKINCTGTASPQEIGELARRQVEYHQQ